MKKHTLATKRTANKKQAKRKDQRIYPFSDDNFDEDLSKIIIIPPKGDS